MQENLTLFVVIRLKPSFRKPKGRTFQGGDKAAKALPETESFHLIV
jgi:hypothetical protein